MSLMLLKNGPRQKAVQASGWIGCGAEETGAMSTMIAGRETPGTGRWVYQFIASAINAACAATIAKAEALQRRMAAWSRTSCSAKAFMAVQVRPSRPTSAILR